MLQDLLLTTDGLRASVVLAPCKLVGERTSRRALGTCASAKFLPVYRCSEYDLCSPFGKVVDHELVHHCLGCEDYTRKGKAVGGEIGSMNGNDPLP